MEWYYASEDDQKLGPVSSDTLKEYLASGMITPDTLVWASGMTNWEPAQQALTDENTQAPTRYCAYSGHPYPESQMLRYGDKFVALENKEAFLQSLKEGGHLEVQATFPDYMDITRRTKLLVVLLSVHAFVALAWIAGDFWFIGTIDQVTFDSFTPAEQFQTGVGIFFLILYITTVTVFGMWIYRSTANAHALGAVGTDYTPGWSVGWYFIPIANLWKPYQAMSETYRSSIDPHNWMTSPAPGILGIWWFFWIVNIVIERIATRLSLSAETNDDLVASSTLSIVNEAVFFVLCLVAIQLVRSLNRIQTKRAEDAEQQNLL